MGISFVRPAPKIGDGERNVQNSARFPTTFDFDREHLRNGSTYRKLEKYLINYTPFHVGWKELGELWSTNINVIEAHIDPPKRTFFGRLHFGPWGVLAPQIFTRVTNWPNLANAPPNWEGVPSKNFNRENLKFGLKFSAWAPGWWEYPHKAFFRRRAARQRWQNGYSFWKTDPLKFGRAKKNLQNSARFLTTFDFDREYLQNGLTYRKSEEYLINYNPFDVGWKKHWVHFGLQTKCYRGSDLPTLSGRSV